MAKLPIPTTSAAHSANRSLQVVKKKQFKPFSLYTAAAFSVIFLAHTDHHLSNTIYAAPIQGPISGAEVAQEPYLQPSQQPSPPPPQQILSLYTPDSITSDIYARLSKYKQYHHFSLGGRYKEDSSTVNESIDHFTPLTVDNSLFVTDVHVESNRILHESRNTLRGLPKQDEQSLAFMNLYSRVSGKSRDQVEMEIWEDQQMSETSRQALETRLNMQKLKKMKENDRVAERVSKQSAVSKLSSGDITRSGKKKEKKQDNKVVKPLNKSKDVSIKATPSIFYVPHQDDDALAMALAIREHIEAGRKVIVHLYSDGVNALLRDIVAGTSPCTLQHPSHKLDLTLQDVVTGRTHEFRQSLRTLGVQDENIFETGWSDIEPFKDYAAFQAKLRDLILGYERKYPGASHKCISGEYDRDSVGRNPTHRACWDVAAQLLQEFPQGWPASHQLWDFRFYRTYTYYSPPTSRSAQFIRPLPQFLSYKQRALDQYKRWDPTKGELAWGYHSVKALIDAAYNDPHVYLDMLDNDPTNPINFYKIQGSLVVKGEKKAETEGIEVERWQGMFPEALISNHKEDGINELYLKDNQENKEDGESVDEEGHVEADLEDDLMGLYRTEPEAQEEREGDRKVVEEEKDEATEPSRGRNVVKEETEWNEKEADLRLQILEEFIDVVQRPKGKGYHDGNLAKEAL
ncbi:hypothetical protein FBU30_004632 [Linnemannia zychae]|nr:hypothetical protein FBU30_004632 [Linnemannia zychae]